MLITWPSKRPNEILDYSFDWAEPLGTDTVATSTFALVNSDSGVVINSNSHNQKITSVWLSGGTDGTTARLTNTIITAAGRTMQATASLQVKAV